MGTPSKRARRGEAGDDATRAAPAFSLYGETSAAPDDDFVHIEEIAARSQRYGWEIGRHVHHGLCQILSLTSGEVAYRLDEDAGTSAGPCATISRRLRGRPSRPESEKSGACAPVSNIFFGRNQAMLVF